MLGGETKTFDRVLMILMLTMQTLTLIVFIASTDQIGFVIEKLQQTREWRAETSKRLTTLDERLGRIEDKLGLKPSLQGK